jgi:hypothetical protein
LDIALTVVEDANGIAVSRKNSDLADATCDTILTYRVCVKRFRFYHMSDWERTKCSCPLGGFHIAVAIVRPLKRGACAESVRLVTAGSLFRWAPLGCRHNTLRLGEGRGHTTGDTRLEPRAPPRIAATATSNMLGPRQIRSRRAASADSDSQLASRRRSWRSSMRVPRRPP